MPKQILIRYGEIALKGKNRRFFEDILQKNLTAAVDGTGTTISRRHGRFLADAPEENVKRVLNALSRVFGVTSISEVEAVPPEMPEIKKAALRLAGNLSPTIKTFKVNARRANKTFPFTSPEINREVGAFLLNERPDLKVDVHQPDWELSIEVGHREVFLFSSSIPAPRGLPVGVSGRALVLLSGGIDSPVAAWMAMSRGLEIEALHFHSHPFTGERAKEKVIDLCRVLARYCGEIRLHLVGVTEVQKELKMRAPEYLGITLLRRVMLRLAEEVSLRRRLQAIVTGESLGQVASQTLESLQTISAATRMLILRPLVGMDKHEIVRRAHEIETYAISTRPYDDCCTLFLPRHPAIRPDLYQVQKTEASLDLNSYLQASLQSMETILIHREFTT